MPTTKSTEGHKGICHGTSGQRTAFAQLPSTRKLDVIKIGAKYHRATCHSLSKSKIEMSLADAARRYSPCKICKLLVLGDVDLPAGDALQLRNQRQGARARNVGRSLEEELKELVLCYWMKMRARGQRLS
jgi:hypothetical protein